MFYYGVELHSSKTYYYLYMFFLQFYCSVELHSSKTHNAIPFYYSVELHSSKTIVMQFRKKAMRFIIL